ncbi:hypothetical protein FA13DRAFT_1793955 [Coprinellus micaceus]|uniref:Uncharacterized protein n=1 Tax=Coprinellus micaceus TaxID=71717 RepID=A0A4Y7T2V5_COPMI|nr:hypothetical protein FA13DRAFT_1793955 [Coprinellus micaceus]
MEVCRLTRRRTLERSKDGAIPSSFREIIAVHVDGAIRAHRFVEHSTSLQDGHGLLLVAQCAPPHPQERHIPPANTMATPISTVQARRWAMDLTSHRFSAILKIRWGGHSSNLDSPFFSSRPTASASTKHPIPTMMHTIFHHPRKWRWRTSWTTLASASLEIDSETTSDSTPGHGSIYFSDSDEDLGQEENDEDGMFSFGYSTLRSTCFRVSSERGQWKDDPLALEPSATANLASRLRQSSHCQSTSTAEEPPLSAESAHHDSDGKEDETLSSIPLSDRPLTPEPQALPEYSSPLPPSSPLLSPMSGAVSSMSRSVSPLSLPPSSPALMPYDHLHSVEDEDNETRDDDTLDVAGASSASTTLAEALFPEDEEDADMHMDVEKEAEPLNLGRLSPTLPPSPLLSTSHTDTSSSHGPNPTQPSKSTPIAPPAPSGSSIRSGSPDENAAAAAKVKGKGEKQKARPSTDEKPLQDQIDNSQLPSSSSSTVPEPKRLKKQAKARASEAPPKRKADEFVESVSDAPAPTKKRRQGTVPVERVASSSSMNAVVQPKEEDESEDDHDALPQLKASSSKGKRKRATSSKPTKAHRASKLFALESPQKTNDTELIPEDVDAEIQGMIIECMATSRASSMPVSLVVRTVLQTHPGLKEKRTEKEWRKVVGRVLVNGMAGRGSGVFGKVDSSGKDDSDRPLEAQWFYVPEMDQDQDRAALIRSMMPRPGKRTVTKQYKQYYWRPLDKISRWDPDDAL